MISVLAPAKVNLFLSVGRRDERGYHPLRTMFQAIALFDMVQVSPGAEKTSVSFDDPSVPQSNTVTKALELYSMQAEVPPVTVHVRKQIPSEAGLGGGSTDAAAALRALQLLLGSPVTDAQLAEIAFQVGADVPFFLVGGRAQAEGYGEILKLLPDGPRRWLTIATPSERCSTASMFQKLDLLEYEWRHFPSEGVLHNDFERVAPCACLELIERTRVHGAEDAGLTGSGSAVFGIYGSESEARNGAKGLAQEGVPWIRVVPTLTRAQSLSH